MYSVQGQGRGSNMIATIAQLLEQKGEKKAYCVSCWPSRGSESLLIPLQGSSCLQRAEKLPYPIFSMKLEVAIF